MYKITCARIGKGEHLNRNAKGMFLKEFNTLSELAAYFTEAKRSVWFPKLGKELTLNERKILVNKCQSIARANRGRKLVKESLHRS